MPAAGTDHRGLFAAENGEVALETVDRLGSDYSYSYTRCMSDLIRTTREELGLTGTQLAEQLGVTVGAISQMERSEREGRIKLDTLERALDAMGRRITIGTRADSAYASYGPAAVTDQVNDALDQRDQSYALRLITHAAQVVAASADEFADEDLNERPSQIKDDRWEQLFRAVYGRAIPETRRPDWAKPSKLKRRWYVSRFPSLQEKAKTSTPSSSATSRSTWTRSRWRHDEGIRR